MNVIQQAATLESSRGEIEIDIIEIDMKNLTTSWPEPCMEWQIQIIDSK